MAGQKQFDINTVLDDSANVFWLRGYEGTSIQHLVDATGVNRGSLYGTFGSKKALFLASLERYVRTVSDCLFAALAPHEDDHQRAIAALFDAIVDRYEALEGSAGCMIANSAAESFALDLEIQEAVRVALAKQQAAVRDVLLRARERSDLSDDVDVDELALFVVSTAQALAVMHRAGTTPDMLRAVGRTALAAVPGRESASVI